LRRLSRPAKRVFRLASSGGHMSNANRPRRLNQALRRRIGGRHVDATCLEPTIKAAGGRALIDPAARRAIVLGIGVLARHHDEQAVELSDAPGFGWLGWFW
jgi:hypothetical protein